MHLRLRFQNLGKPRTAGLCGRAAGACDCGPLSCAKSNGLRHSKNLPVKFGFSSKTVPANIAKKLPAQRCSKPLFIAFFSLSHKRPTFAFTGESGYTLGFRRRIAHKGTHGETGAFPPSSTAGLCAASEIALSAAFVTPDSATLLYTYISRFSVTPHYQQQFYLRPSFITFFNFSHKRPTFAFTAESGYTLAFANRIAHKGTHGETGGVSEGGWYLYPRSVSHVSETLRGQVSERQTLPLLGLGWVYSRRTQKAFGTAMRLCASLFRGVAAPLGCVIFSVSVEIAACMPCAQGLSVCARRGVVSLPSARFTCC